MEYDNLYRIFKEAGDDAGISKDTNPQHFRRSRASFLAGKPSVSEAELRKYFGWSYDSNSPKHYIAKFRQDIDRNIALADGANVDVFEQQQQVAPIECGACGQWTERYVTDCVHCGAEVDDERHEAHVDATMAGADTDLLSMIMSGEVGPEDLRSVKKLWAVIRDRPKLGSELDTLIEKTERMIDDGKTNAYGGISACVGILVGRSMDAVAQAATVWACAKHEGMKRSPQWEHYPKMSVLRQVVLGVGIGVMLSMLLGAWYVSGTIQGLAAGEATAWIPVLISVIYTVALLDQDLPSA